MRLACLFGRHWYKTGEENLKLLAEDDRAWAYEITNTCVYCGAENVIYAKIPKPAPLRAKVRMMP